MPMARKTGPNYPAGHVRSNHPAALGRCPGGGSPVWTPACPAGYFQVLPFQRTIRSLAFARTQLTGQGRPGRFGPAQIVAEQAPATERLVAFPGRAVNTGH